jgi:hypothetical protein
MGRRQTGQGLAGGHGILSIAGEQDGPLAHLTGDTDCRKPLKIVIMQLRVASWRG